MVASFSPRYMIRNLWNVAPVLKTNLVTTGLVDHAFNETLKRAAVMAFEEYTSTRLGGESNPSSTTTTSTSTRRRRQRPQKSTRTSPTTTMRQPHDTTTTSQQHLTDNDFFFQHQKNRGYRHANQSIATCECAEKLQETFITNVVKDYLKHSSSSSMEKNHHPNHELFSIDMWVAIQRGKGAYHADHVHEGALVSGVYYASVPLVSAPLVLRRPKNSTTSSTNGDDEQFPPYVVLSPTEGDLVLFPPWLEHGVPMVSSEEQQAATTKTNHLPRVSFAFNATGAFASLGNENDDLWNHTTRTNNLA